MKVTRRNFIKLGAFGGFAAATNLFAPAVCSARAAASGSVPAGVLSDPLHALSATDFSNYVGTQFSLLNSADGTHTVGVLSKVTAKKNSRKAPNRSEGVGRRKGKAENFTLSFRLPNDDFPQATYLVQHANLGQFDLFLVPGEAASGEKMLHAVINRI